MFFEQKTRVTACFADVADVFLHIRFLYFKTKSQLKGKKSKNGSGEVGIRKKISALSAELNQTLSLKVVMTPFSFFRLEILADILPMFFADVLSAMPIFFYGFSTKNAYKGYK